MENLNVSPSPHVFHEDTRNGILTDIIIALIPLVIAGCLTFGFYSALVILMSIIATTTAEFCVCKVLKTNSPPDLATVSTGLILGLSLPPALPLWMVAVGGLFAGAIKQLFKKIGLNLINSVIVARTILEIIFYKMMNSYWVSPRGTVSKFVSGVTFEEIDIITSATPLSQTAIEGEYYSIKQLSFGQVAGCIGETFSLLIIIGLLYLVLRKVISPIIPISIIGSVALLSLIFGQNPIYMIFSGSVLFCAVFIATDFATSPVGFVGKLIFGLCIGIITFVLRKFTPLPEGVGLAILIMNLTVPFIEHFTLNKPFGFKEQKAV